MDWEKITELALNESASRENLALLFIESVSQINSADEMKRLVEIFLNTRCRLGIWLVLDMLQRVHMYHTFEIHNSPCGIIIKPFMNPYDMK